MFEAPYGYWFQPLDFRTDLLQQAHSGSRSGAQGHVAPTVIVSIEPDVKTPVTTNGNTNASNNADVSETSFIDRRTFVIGLTLQGVGIFSTQVFIAPDGVVHDAHSQDARRRQEPAVHARPGQAQVHLWLCAGGLQ